MKPSVLFDYLKFAVGNNYPVLVTGKPGGAKTDTVEAAVKDIKADLITSHPVVSDPTDYKGLPFPNKDATAADFLPYGDLSRLVKAKKKTVFFLDDLGQAPISVQAAVMQLLLARKINGHVIGNQVTFLAATNRRQDKAGVAGILEPVKSRFKAIIEMEVDHNDWVKWAIQHNMPDELIAFIRWRPNFIEDDITPSKNIENSPSPRTIAHAGMQQANGLPLALYREVFSGAAGPAFGVEYCAFLESCKQLPSLDDIIKNPEHIPIPSNPSMLYAITGGLAKKMTDATITPISKFLERIQPELSVACMTDAQTRNPKICENKTYALWAEKNHKNII